MHCFFNMCSESLLCQHCDRILRQTTCRIYSDSPHGQAAAPLKEVVTKFGTSEEQDSVIQKPGRNSTQQADHKRCCSPARPLHAYCSIVFHLFG